MAETIGSVRSITERPGMATPKKKPFPENTENDQKGEMSREENVLAVYSK